MNATELSNLTIDLAITAFIGGAFIIGLLVWANRHDNHNRKSKI